jgi:hypothetical protein
VACLLLARRNAKQKHDMLFNLAGFKAKALVGGYKSYRRKAQEYFESPFNLIVLGE